jgi:dihydroorotate dehydrogenase
VYRLVFRHLLTRLDAERAHALTGVLVRLLSSLPGALALLRWVTRPAPELRVRALGLEFPSPLGVAAGLDKELTSFELFGALGFGFVEVGTITAVPQEGNPRPRVHRLLDDRALLNSMGFPNPGASAAAMRLRARSRAVIVGANVGKSKVASLDEAGADYAATLRSVGSACDYIVLNVSSPNTQGLRDMQGVERLAALIADVRAVVGTSRPLLVKVAPDLTGEQLDDIADLAVSARLDGIIAVNTTLRRDGLAAPASITSLPGGISGAPLKERAVEVLQQLRARVGDAVVLISVGGIETADDAFARILAGATLVQAYTGFIYGGPGWPAAINRGLAERLRGRAMTSIEDAIGADAPLSPPGGP